MQCLRAGGACSALWFNFVAVKVNIGSAEWHRDGVSRVYHEKSVVPKLKCSQLEVLPVSNNHYSS